jgi:Mrp family chromosome partitioning ATPase
MTRIFDALRKSQASREPAMLPAPPALVQPVRPAHSAPRPVAERLVVAPLAPAAPLDEDVLREMSGLRVSLEGLLPGRSPRSVIFVSAQGGDGTSTVALQFAQSLSREAELRVLLVDANLRRPSPLIEAARAGAGESHGRGALDLLPLGERLRRSEPVPMTVFRELIEHAGSGYDWMILDGSALLESPEVAPMAAQVDGVVMVLRSGRSKRPVLLRALDLLRRSNANVVGTVLNRRRLEIPDFIYRRI